MKFSAFSIRNQEFNKAVRGYDREEVRAFLETLSDEVDEISRENERLKIEVENQLEQLVNFKKIEKNLQSTLLNANENSSRAVESTKKQTALMVKEAELKCARIIDNAKEEANLIRSSVLKLREERRLLIARLKAMVETQSGILEYDLNNKTTIKTSSKAKTETEVINVDAIVEKLL